MTVKEVAAFLRAHDSYLILTHRRPDGDTLGCAAALCAMLRQMGKTAALLPNAEVTSLYADYVAPYWAAEDYRYETVVSVDLAALGLFPDNAERFKNRADLAIDHHPSYEGFGRESCVHPECAACGEILYELAVELGQLTPAVALPLYVAVSTDTGCFVYSNVTANTHRVAAALMETGIDYRAANKRHFRTKTKKRLALEAELLRTMEFYDEGRVVVVTLPLSLAERLSLTEADMDDVSALGGVVEGTDCSITMKETKDGAWKISVRTGARVNATKACAALGCGGCMAALRRTMAAGFRIEEAVTLERAQEEREALLLPLDEYFRAYPRFTVQNETQEKRAYNGNAFTARGVADGEYRVYDRAGTFLSLSRAEGGELHAIKNFF